MVFDMIPEVRGIVKNGAFRGEHTRGESEALEVLSHANVPIYVVLEDEGCREILLDDSETDQLMLDIQHYE